MKKRLLTLLLVLVMVTAITATIGFAAEPNSESLTGNVNSKTISEDTKLNLAGHTIGTLIVEPGVTVTISGAGATGTITTIQGGGIVELADGFMLWGGAGNKLTLGTAGISLRADNIAKNGASVYYTSTFGGNAAVKNQITAYGVAMYVGNSANLFADNTYTRNDDLSGWDTSKATFNDNGVLLKGILKTGNAYSVNKSNATKQIYNVPYVELADGTRITGATVNRSLQNVVEQVTAQSNPGSDFWDTSMNATQKTNVVNMYNTFERFMSTWTMPRLEPLVDDKANTSYPLYTASDVTLMASKPDESYTLMANIDMKGAAINGITGFTGSITGNGKTLSNVTVNGVGLVDAVAAGQTISNLHLRDVNVVVPSKSTATAVGTIAGTNNGTITGSSATGSVKDTRANVAMGALVGNNAGTLTPSTAVTDTIVANTFKTDGSGIGNKNTTYTTANLAASVGLYNTAAGVTKGLIGTGNAVANAANVYWRDRSDSSEGQVATLQERRQIVVDDVYAQGTMQWTVPSKMAYYNDQKNQPSFNKGDREWVQTGRWPWQGEYVGLYHIHNQQFNPGTVYNGIPYTHISSSLEQARFYMTQNANGVYVFDSTIASKVGGSDNKAGNATWSNGGLGWAQYLGSDCSGALALAWHKVSPIRDLNRTESNKGVSPYYTSNIVPSEFNQWSYGIVKVGDYTINDKALATEYEFTGTDFTTSNGKQTKTDYGITTDAIIMYIKENQGGIQTVYEAYADSKKGDILVASGKAGHTRMLALDPVVIRNANGAIDAAKSYFVTFEQGDGLYERAQTNSSWRINYKYTFEQLAYENTEGLTGSTGYYLPVTMKAFHDVSMPTTKGITLSGGRAIGDTNDPSYVVINGSYRIQSATMVIKDAQGNVLYNKTAYQGASSSQNRRRAVPGNVPMYMSEFFSDYGKNLTAGETYYFTLSGTTFASTAPNNVYTNQAFVYTPAA